MLQWIETILGMIIGLALVMGCLYWAFAPRPKHRRSWLAPPSGARDPETALNNTTDLP